MVHGLLSYPRGNSVFLQNLGGDGILVAVTDQKLCYHKYCLKRKGSEKGICIRVLLKSCSLQRNSPRWEMRWACFVCLGFWHWKVRR